MAETNVNVRGPDDPPTPPGTPPPDSPDLPPIAPDGSEIKSVPPPTQPVANFSANQTLNPHLNQAGFSQAPAQPPAQFTQPQAQFTQPQAQFTQMTNYQPMANPTYPTAIAQQPVTNQTLWIDKYTERSIMVRGDTKTYYTELKRLGGTWISRPKQGNDPRPGWCFSISKQQEVVNYVTGVNSGVIAAPLPSAPTQNVRYDVFRPQQGMRLKITMPHGVGDYIVGNVSQNGFLVTEALVYDPRNPQNVHKMVLVKKAEEPDLKWQILGYNDNHSIEAIVETTQ